MVTTIKMSQFPLATQSDSTDVYVGVGSGANIKTGLPFRWTTVTRPSSPYNGLFGFNTNLNEFEFWDGAQWIQLAAGATGTVNEVDTGTGLTGGPITDTGTISFAAIAAHSLWANTTAGSAVPTVTPLSTFLLSANNLSDLTNAATARTNIGLQIGVNVQAWSAVLDSIVAGTLPTSVQLQIGSFNHGTGASATTFWRGDGTWGVPAGGGTVNAGLVNQLAYYASSGTAVSGLATANNGVLITSAGGVPSISSTLPAAVQGNITSLGTITSGIWQANIIDMAFGGTGANLVPSNGGIVYTNASNMAILGNTATATQMLQSGASGAPAWSTTTWPATSTINQLLYSSAANTITGLATANNGVLVTSAGGVPSIGSTLPAAVQGNITAVGTITSGTWQGSLIALAFGGTNANLIASNGGIFYSTATAGAILAGTITANQILMSGASSAPSWSTATYPATTTINNILFSSAANTISEIAAVNGGVLVSNNTGVPSMLANPGANGRMLQSANAAIPAWSTASWPATTTANQLLYSSATNTVGGLTSANSAILFTNSSGVPAWSSSLTNGQLMIGSTGASPTPATLTAGTGISISNTAGAITISASGGGVGWTEVTGTSQAMTSNNGYIANNAGLVSLSLPTTSAVGDVLYVAGKGAGGFTITQASGQQIHVGSSASTSGAGGSISSTNQFDSMQFVCLTANTIWSMLGGPQGNITVV